RHLPSLPTRRSSDLNGLNGNFGEWSNYPPFLNPSGWGNQPSFSLVNSYKTQDGLPLIETWNDFDITNDMGMDLNEPFTPYAGPLDRKSTRLNSSHVK